MTWTEDANWPRSEWQQDVANGDTQLGYWPWVAHNAESTRATGSDAAIEQLHAWHAKIADLLNHGLSDAEAAEYFTLEQARNLVRDYIAVYRKSEVPDAIDQS